MLRTGTAWEHLPRELGGGSAMTCWRRVRELQQAGGWAKLHRALLDRLEQADQLDWSRTALDSASVAAKRGARQASVTFKSASEVK